MPRRPRAPWRWRAGFSGACLAVYNPGDAANDRAREAGTVAPRFGSSRVPAAARRGLHAVRRRRGRASWLGASVEPLPGARGRASSSTPSAVCGGRASHGRVARDALDPAGAPMSAGASRRMEGDGWMKAFFPLAAMLLTGCTMSFGPVGVIGQSSDAVAVKLLRPGVEGRSCQRSILGVLVDGEPPTLAASLEQILALDREGDVVTNGEVVSEEFVTGFYNRRCVVLRGDLARTIPVVRMPAGTGHHEHH